MKPITLDRHMLVDLYGGSYDDVRFILNDYLDKHDDIINSFREAYASGIEPLSKCAHRHSSSFSYIGVPELTSACKNFEQECKNAPDTSAVSTQLEALLSTIDQAAVLVKEELKRLEKA